MSTITSYDETDTAATANKLVDKAKDIGARARAAVADQTDMLTDKLRPKLDAINDYARDEPTKALLIAAATGAGLMALVALAASRTSSSRLPSVDTSDFASALRDFVSRAPKAADDAASTANSAAKEGNKRASAAADMIADTWAQLRDQAGPVVDKIKPQIDAATAFVKDDPVKTAAGVAIAGALVAGLVALIRGRTED